MIIKFLSFLLLFLIVLPSIAFASAWRECKVRVNIVTLDKKNSSDSLKADIKLLRSPWDCKGHSLPKKYSSGQTLSVMIEMSPVDKMKVTSGDVIVLKLYRYEGMGPAGLVSVEKWSLIKLES